MNAEEDVVIRPLTARQTEILALTTIGSHSKIARRLNVSVGTVSVTLRDVRRKLGVTTTAEAVHVARERGWIR